MAVQQQSVSIIQMVSLPVSFLSIAWASVVADEFVHFDERHPTFSVKNKVILFVTHLFILSSTLCSCFVPCKLQVVGYQCFDPSLYVDNDL